MNNIFSDMPSELILVDGKVLMKDGSDSQEYLRKFQRDTGIKDASFINLVPRYVAQRNREAEQIRRTWDPLFPISS